MSEERDNTTQEFENLIREYSPLEIPVHSIDESAGIPAIDSRSLATIPVVPGTQPVDVSVRSVYDTRPVNAYDVIFNVPFLLPDGRVTIVQGLNTVTANVPSGYVAVIREIKFVIEPTPAISILDTDYLLTLLLNNGAVPNYRAIPVGPIMNNWLPAHLIAGENQTFGIILNVLPAIAALAFTLNVQFHCNLLLSTGAPTAFEIGNPQPNKPAIVSEQPQAPVDILPQQYERYKQILAAAMNLKLINTFQAPPFNAFKAAYSQAWWDRTMGPLLLGIKNLTGKSL